MSKLAALIYAWILRHSDIPALGILEAVCVEDALRILIPKALAVDGATDSWMAYPRKFTLTVQEK